MTELQKALINLGRINKTIYMLNFIDDTWISAMKLSWREVDWLGEDLRYGPK